MILIHWNILVTKHPAPLLDDGVSGNIFQPQLGWGYQVHHYGDDKHQMIRGEGFLW